VENSRFIEGAMDNFDSREILNQNSKQLAKKPALENKNNLPTRQRFEAYICNGQELVVKEENRNTKISIILI
jgi:hypothetical protein